MGSCSTTDIFRFRTLAIFTCCRKIVWLMCFCDHLTNESVNNYCFTYIFLFIPPISQVIMWNQICRKMYTRCLSWAFFCSKLACSYCLIFPYYQQLPCPENFLNANLLESLTITDHFFLRSPVVTSYDILCLLDIELNGNSQVFFLTKKCV